LIFSPRNIASILARSPHLFRELDKQPERLVVDAILRIVQEDAGGLRRHPLAARRVIRKQVSQVPALDCAMAICQRPPCC
jgi:hypothetical protein